ncbi:hypothetical protein HDU96_006120 [Phlyctochytrium bullatum]|nr:hypothetical protein HDU96_006120 [Phlyctochytrium bullatum]
MSSSRPTTPDIFRQLADGDINIEFLLRKLVPLKQKQRNNQFSNCPPGTLEFTLAETEKKLKFTLMVPRLNRVVLKKNAESGLVRPANWIQTVVDAAQQKGG